MANSRLLHLDLGHDCGIATVSELHKAWLDWLHGGIHTRIFGSATVPETKQSWGTAVPHSLPGSTCTFTSVVIEVLQVSTSPTVA